MSVGAIVPQGTTTGRTAFNYNWEIPDFFSRMTRDGVISISSPEFSFSGGNWKWWMDGDRYSTPYHKEYDNTLELYLCRQRPIREDKTIFCTVWVKKSDGTAKDPTTNIGTFYKNDPLLEPRLFIRFSYLRLLDLEHSSSELVPSGTLTIAFSIQDFVIGTSEPEPVAVTDTLARDFKSLLLSCEDSDAIVRVKGQDFPVHRAILGARTPVIRAMFRHNTTEKTSGIVDIEDFEPDTVRRFLEYVYSGQVEDMAAGNATDLYEVADKYQVEPLKQKCLDCIEIGLSVDNFCHAFTLAMKHDERQLLTLATDFFAGNMKTIARTDKWKRFLSENPIEANELFLKALVTD